jgi:predicted dehydrogenase
MSMGISTRPDGLPASVAIAGAWGYIGRKFLDVSLARGLTVYIYDPGPAPVGVDLGRLTRVADEATFYRLPADLFHLALHPEHRRLDLLLARREPLLILNEKPMALPQRPEDCQRIVDAVDAAPAVVFYDFPELFDPLTGRVLDHLAGFREIRLTGFFVQRSKDREDPGLPRNFKRMVPIQYQETVHCLAYVLYVLAAVKGGVPAALADGVVLAGESEPYAPPNADAYPYAVDGRCRFAGSIGGVPVEGLTDFKRGAPWVKRRVIRGIGDGAPFEIDVSYLEGRKTLRIDGVAQPWDLESDSYEHVLRTAARWARQYNRLYLMDGLFPNPRFTLAAYQLSAALWRSCRDRKEVNLPGRPADHRPGSHPSSGVSLQVERQRNLDRYG